MNIYLSSKFESEFTHLIIKNMNNTDYSVLYYPFYILTEKVKSKTRQKDRIFFW